ncbi:MAG: LicD family protein [Tidjanibacter sp.]|nr:LicD family protein [Tidjanibacter sp.]
MLGGTQLGAVRHKGIIPWDDDMDFGVPREYYGQLKQVLTEDLKEPYTVISIDNTPGYYGGFIKIEDSRTVAEFTEQNDNSQYGINIDIFPLDKTNGRVGFFSRNNIICQLYKVENYRFYNIVSESRLKTLFSKTLKVLLPFLHKKSIYNFIERRLLPNEGDYMANYYGAWGLREIVKMSYFGEPMLYEFDGKKFYGVENPDKYLKSLYGDYMQLPPEDKRHIHMNKAYYK